MPTKVLEAYVSYQHDFLYEPKLSYSGQHPLETFRGQSNLDNCDNLLFSQHEIKWPKAYILEKLVPIITRQRTDHMEPRIVSLRKNL
jgi:hypothetical protein